MRNKTSHIVKRCPASEFGAAESLAPSPRAGGRARTCARHWRVPGESEPHAGGDVDGLGWGSKLGQRCACIRPPSRPVLQTAPSQRLDSATGVLGPLDPSTAGRRPCPGEGAFPDCRRIDDLSGLERFSANYGPRQGLGGLSRRILQREARWLRDGAGEFQQVAGRMRGRPLICLEAGFFSST